MVKYSFNVCCDSSNNYYSQIDGSTTTFAFNWSVIPDKKYDVTFSYMSDDATTTLSPVMSLWTDLDGTPETYLASGSTSSQRIGFLGTLRADKHGQNSFYYADQNTNPSVRMQRPSNSFFTVYLRKGLTTAAYATPIATQYVLMLHFEECDEYWKY